MNLFAYSSQKKLDWKKIFYKLYRNQYKCTVSYVTPRKRRQLQRLILTSFSTKLIVIRQLLINSFVSTNRFIKNFIFFDPFCPDYMDHIWEYKSIQLNILFLQKQTYCENIIIQIQQIVWIFAFLPIHEKLSQRLNWQCRISKHSRHMLEYLKCEIKTNSVQWICFFKFRFLLSKRIKIWLLKNCWIEKKFLLHFFYTTRNQIIQYEQFHLMNNTCISMKRLLKSFFLLVFFNHLKRSINNASNTHNTIWVLYTNLLVVSSTDFSYNYIFNSLKNETHAYNVFTVKSFESHSIAEGFVLYGWFIQKSKNRLVQKIHAKNIRSHQLEIKRFLKNAGNFTIDQVIYYLNQKIQIWKDIYLKMCPSSSLRKKLNHYLFWRIWYFLRKRHNTKGAKWVLQKYYTKDRHEKWVFQAHHMRLISYNSSALEKESIHQIE